MSEAVETWRWVYHGDATALAKLAEALFQLAETEIACEQIDNFLCSIASSITYYTILSFRESGRFAASLSRALQCEVSLLDRGEFLERATILLSDQVRYCEYLARYTPAPSQFVAVMVKAVYLGSLSQRIDRIDDRQVILSMVGGVIKELLESDLGNSSERLLQVAALYQIWGRALFYDDDSAAAAKFASAIRITDSSDAKKVDRVRSQLDIYWLCWKGARDCGRSRFEAFCALLKVRVFQTKAPE
jgi:hypothetical protein